MQIANEKPKFEMCRVSFTLWLGSVSWLCQLCVDSFRLSDLLLFVRQKWFALLSSLRTMDSFPIVIRYVKQEGRSMRHLVCRGMLYSNDTLQCFIFFYDAIKKVFLMDKLVDWTKVDLPMGSAGNIAISKFFSITGITRWLTCAHLCLYRVCEVVPLQKYECSNTVNSFSYFDMLLPYA